MDSNGHVDACFVGKTAFLTWVLQISFTKKNKKTKKERKKKEKNKYECYTVPNVSECER